MALDKESIEVIFLMMSMKNDDLEQSHKAYNEFYKRYSQYLYAITERVCSNFVNLYGNTLTESVFSNTILKVYEKSYKFIRIEDFKTEKEKDKNVKAWLGKIALNEMRMLLRKYKEDSSKIVYDSDLINEKEFIIPEDKKEKFKSINKENLDRALQSLKPREREILLSYYLYKVDGKYIPSNILEELCEMHNTTKENIRQIVKRTKDKIKKIISEYQKI